MPSAWITHVKKTYAAGKSKGMTYSQAMVAGKKTYRKGSKGAASEAAAPKKRRRKKKTWILKRKVVQSSTQF